jgi:hypothetical protein
MAINFPAGPTDGDTYYDGTRTWVYASATGSWAVPTASGGVAGGSTIDYQATEPTSPAVGQMWVDSDGTLTGGGTTVVSDSFNPFFLRGT